MVDGNHLRFDYVYDCGALSGGRVSKALKSAFRRMDLCERDGLPASEVIDALVLSHFDQDHMNGAEELTESHRVERIYLPYLAPTELALELARQANTLANRTVRQLHELASGGDSLWGVPVTLVTGGPGLPRDDLGGDRPEPQSNLPDSTLMGFPEPRQQKPKQMRASIGATKSAIQKNLSHNDDIRIGSGITEIWQLRFWNPGVDHEFVFYVLMFLGLVGFPLNALDRRDGADEILAWLNVPGHRDDAHEAYLHAVRCMNGTWNVSAGDLPNFISLALFSGPWHWRSDDENRDDRYRYFSSYRRVPPEYVSHRPFPIRWPSNRVGWLGTGDALLGEGAVWNDFELHYSHELPRVRTVLLPHHGAAPRGGPAFYNDGLNSNPDVVSVLSVGKKNPYGHPRPEVVKRVVTRFGLPVVVTEEWTFGFHEIVWQPP